VHLTKVASGIKIITTQVRLQGKPENHLLFFEPTPVSPRLRGQNRSPTDIEATAGYSLKKIINSTKTNFNSNEKDFLLERIANVKPRDWPPFYSGGSPTDCQPNNNDLPAAAPPAFRVRLINGYGPNKRKCTMVAFTPVALIRADSGATSDAEGRCRTGPITERTRDLPGGRCGDDRTGAGQSVAAGSRGPGGIEPCCCWRPIHRRRKAECWPW
jgi:hypothetical protein